MRVTVYDGNCTADQVLRHRRSPAARFPSPHRARLLWIDEAAIAISPQGAIALDAPILAAVGTTLQISIDAVHHQRIGRAEIELVKVDRSVELRATLAPTSHRDPWRR